MAESDRKRFLTWPELEACFHSKLLGSSPTMG